MQATTQMKKNSLAASITLTGSKGCQLYTTDGCLILTITPACLQMSYILIYWNFNTKLNDAWSNSDSLFITQSGQLCELIG